MDSIRHNIIFSVVAHSILLAAALLIGNSSELRKVSFMTVLLSDEKEGSSPGKQTAIADVKKNVQALVPPKAAMTTVAKLSTVQGSLPKQIAEPLSPVNPQSDTGSRSVPGVTGINAQGNSSEVGGGSPSSGGQTSRGSSGEAGAASASRGQTGQATETGADASLKQRIRDTLQANLVYPYIARKRGMEGTVRVEFLIDNAGIPENIRIMKGSGYLVLDSAARETVMKASPFPFRNSVIDVPITYRLTQRAE